MKFLNCIRFRKGFVFFTALSASALCLDASANLVRSLRPVSPDRIDVEITWGFGAEPESGLIVEEQLPPGWDVDLAASNLSDSFVRIDASRVRIAAGVSTPLTDAGTITYSLVSDSADPTAPLHFYGAAQTMLDAHLVEIPIGGVQTYSAEPPPPGSNSGKPLYVSGVSSTSSLSGPGILFRYMLDAPIDEPESDAQTGGLAIAPRTQEPAPNVHVEHTPSLVGHITWTSIYICAPDGDTGLEQTILLQGDLETGFYRLRIEE